MKRLRAIIVSLALAPALAGSCESPIFCTDNIEPGIVVEIRDAATSASIAGGATGYVRDEGYVDSLTAHTNSSLQAALERPGIYEIVVHHEGFQDWRKTGVGVSADECHVRTVRVVALMDSL